jgi:hypothetical protein
VDEPTDNRQEIREAEQRGPDSLVLEMKDLTADSPDDRVHPNGRRAKNDSCPL